MQYKLKYLELVDVTGHDGVDVPVPQVVNNLGEVDLFGEGPGHVLANPGRVAEPRRGALHALVVEYLGVQLTRALLPRPGVQDHRALVRPHLRSKIFLHILEKYLLILK